MEKEEFELLCEKYSPFVTDIINNNVKFYRFNETIKWCFNYDEDMAIMGTCNRKTNVISINLKSVMDACIVKKDLKPIEYFILHEIRHIYQHLIIEDYRNNKEVPIDKEIVEKWIYECEHYVKARDQNGKENPKYFFQDSEMDAYAYSYAVMKYKYGDIDLWTYEYYDDEFWDIVNDWLRAFKEEKL